MRWRRRGRGDGVRPIRPSDVAATRFAGQLSTEVLALRRRIADGIERSEGLLASGQVTAASELISEQQVLVHRFHREIQGALLGAIVEREAEGIFANAPGVEVLHDRFGGRAMPGGAAPAAGGRERVRTVSGSTSLAFTAVAAVAFLFGSISPQPPSTFATAAAGEAASIARAGAAPAAAPASATVIDLASGAASWTVASGSEAGTHAVLGTPQRSLLAGFDLRLPGERFGDGTRSVLASVEALSALGEMVGEVLRDLPREVPVDAVLAIGPGVVGDGDLGVEPDGVDDARNPATRLHEASPDPAADPVADPGTDPVAGVGDGAGDAGQDAVAATAADEPGGDEGEDGGDSSLPSMTPTGGSEDASDPAAGSADEPGLPLGLL